MITLREMYGDDVVDQVLALPLVEFLEPDGSLHYRYELEAERDTWHCCIVGALHVIAAERKGLHIHEMLVETPMHDTARGDAATILGSDLTHDQRLMINHAIDTWDSLETDKSVLEVAIGVLAGAPRVLAGAPR